MNKLLILARKCAALPTLLHFLVHLKCNTLGRKCSSSAALFSSMIRRISRLKLAIYSVSKCSSVGSFPNFSQENRDLREGNDIPPLDEHFPDSHDLGDEYDLSDYDAWLSEADYAELIAEQEWERASWCVEAVDDAIAEEKPGEYPPGFIGDIPF